MNFMEAIFNIHPMPIAILMICNALEKLKLMNRETIKYVIFTYGFVVGEPAFTKLTILFIDAFPIVSHLECRSKLINLVCYL